MKAEIISVGTELLLGEIVDTNAPYLCKHLSAAGVDVYWISQVGDNQGRLVDLLSKAWQRSDLIIITGGLGPTEDDLTREAISQLLGEEMKRDQELEADLRNLFATRGFTFTPNNLKQATLIPSARALPNARGSAPGWLVEKDGHIIVAMPGVPPEMYLMWEKEVMPFIRERSGAGVILSRHLKLAGIGESVAEDKVKSLLGTTNPTIAPYAKEDGVHLRLTAKAGTETEAQQMIAGLEAKVREILGAYIYGVDEETPEETIGRMIEARGLTLSTMESSTGGLLASSLTDVPGSSRYFKGGLIAYSLERMLGWGVPRKLIDAHGRASVEVAVAMAGNVRRLTGTAIGLGLAGAAGPGDLDGGPPGTIHIAVDAGGEVTTSSALFPTSRAAYKRRAVLAAVNLLRTALLRND